MNATLFDGLPGIARENEPMARHTSFAVGGPVRYFIEPRDWDTLHTVFRRCHDAGLALRILGRGSNILVTDPPHPWAVVSTRHLDLLHRSGTCVEAGAGTYLPRLVAATEAWGLGGLEPLAGIPGSVGGAVAMNAGGRYGRVANSLVGATVAYPGELPRWVDAAELGLDYRYSIVPRTGLFVLSAAFQLDKAPPRQLVERRLSILAEKHASQPMDACSAGCVFRNPPDGKSAGWLIDQAGLKGTRVGGAVVSHRHANFIVNGGNATAADVLALIDVVTERVRERFGMHLKLEIEVWSNDQEERS